MTIFAYFQLLVISSDQSFIIKLLLTLLAFIIVNDNKG
jgi:hypothetical protein